MSHYINKCKHGKVFGQCRCPSKDKTVNIVGCDCKEDNDSITDYSIPQEFATVTITVETSTNVKTFTVSRATKVAVEPKYAPGESIDWDFTVPMVTYKPDRLESFHVIIEVPVNTETTYTEETIES